MRERTDAEPLAPERRPHDGISGRVADSEAQPTASTPSAAAAQVTEAVEDHVFRLAEEVLYHGARRDFLAVAHRWMMFVTILAGASAAATAYPGASGLLAAATGAADIAFDFTGRSQSHADIRRRYLDLANRCLADPANAKTLFETEWRSISADEPPLYRWAALIAFRNACIAMGRTVPAPIAWWKRLLSQVLRG